MQPIDRPIRHEEYLTHRPTGGIVIHAAADIPNDADEAALQYPT